MAFDELKERQAAVWSSGPYQRITETIADIHDRVIDRLQPTPGMRFLDLACGTGAVAEAAAAAGADVVGIDIAPALIDQAKARASERGLSIDYRVGDAEALDVGDSEFDAVASTCGVMFTPDHAASARELARVTRRGGRIALASWAPESAMAKVFGVMRPFQPAPPPGVRSPFEWGDEDHVRELLGEDFDLELETGESVLAIESGEAAWELFVRDYGPTKTLYEGLDDGQRDELHRRFVELHEASRVDGGLRFSRTYLLALGTRR